MGCFSGGKDGKTNKATYCQKTGRLSDDDFLTCVCVCACRTPSSLSLSLFLSFFLLRAHVRSTFVHCVRALWFGQCVDVVTCLFIYLFIEKKKWPSIAFGLESQMKGVYKSSRNISAS